MKAYLDRFRAWWGTLAEREQRVLAAGAAILALVVLYLGAWEPLAQTQRDRVRALEDARALATLLETLAVEVQRSRGAGGAGTAGAGQSLLAVIDQSRRASSVAKQPRLQVDGDNAVRVWLEDVPFDALLRWLGDLQTRYGVRVDTADIERESGPGLVNARVTLVR